MPSGSATQFRYTQTPSKVLHLRNMPWECTEEELVELCKPFGRVVNTMCNVGANRNQAFVEFVFSAFGFVHKIATFEKAAGFQVRRLYNILMPQLLLKLKIHWMEEASQITSQQSYSVYYNLRPPFDTICWLNRDYTNPYLPVNQTAIEGIVQPTVGPDGKIKEPESNRGVGVREGIKWASATFRSYKAHDERSRDYTLSDPNAQLQAAAQAPAQSTPGVAWQNTAPAAPFYGSTTASAPAGAGQVPAWNPASAPAGTGQVPAWNPNMQGGAFASASTPYPSQPMMANSMPHYPAVGTSSGAPPVPFHASQQMPQYGIPPGAPPHAPPAGQPMYFPK
nr:unnamed protein product [Digitaria exilis]